MTIADHLALLARPADAAGAWVQRTDQRIAPTSERADVVAEVATPGVARP
jgi:hypothetical protein